MESSAEVNVRFAELSARVDALELEALERRIDADGAPGRTEKGATLPASDDPLWLLNGIKQRVPAPGAVYFGGAVEVAAGPVEWQVGFTTDRLLESDWSSLAGGIAALGNPVRLSLLHAVLSGATSVAELSAGEGMGTTGQLYHHLNQLVAQGWLISGGRGHFSVPPERVVPLLVILAAARRTL